MGLLETGLLTALNNAGKKDAQNAQGDANAVARQDDINRREQGLNALTGTNVIGDRTTRNSSGGFDVAPGEQTQNTLNFNKQSSNTSLDALKRAAPTIPDISTARGQVSADNQGKIDLGMQGIDKILQRGNQRPLAGVSLPGSAHQGQVAKEIRNLVSGLDINKNDQANTRFDKSQDNYINQILRLRNAAAPISIPINNVGGQASNVIAQTPQDTPIPQYGSSLATTSASSALQNYFAQQQAAEQSQKYDERLDKILLGSRTQGNQLPSMPTDIQLPVPKYNPPV